jgi:formylglycine-generating enzyme required for sulfatase activity
MTARRVLGRREGVFLAAFAIERTAVSASAYVQCLAAISEDPGAARNDGGLPAVGVLWRQAEANCRWVGRRLPTEAEWQKAARGTDARQYPSGTDWDATKANAVESRRGQPLPSGSLPVSASPCGLRDMSGNVAEWVAGAFDPAYYLVAPETNPLGPVEVLDHGLRAGSWDSPADQATTYFRDFVSLGDT